MSFSWAQAIYKDYYSLLTIYLLGKYLSGDVMDYREVLEIFNRKGCRSILDIGCGTGRFVKMDERVTGIDKNPAKHSRIKRGDATKLPFRDGTFDGALSYQVIEHLTTEQAYRMLSEARRVLRAGGILVLNSPCPFSGFWDTFSHVKPYTPKAIESLLNGQDGVDVENFRRINFRPEKTVYDTVGIPLMGLLRMEKLGRAVSTQLGLLRHDWTMVLVKE